MTPVPPRPINTLMDAISGCYLVFTESGSTYAVDLNDMTIRRERPNDALVGDFLGDGKILRLVGILEATVDREMRLLVDLDLGVGPTRLRSTAVVAIHALRGPSE